MGTMPVSPAATSMSVPGFSTAERGYNPKSGEALSSAQARETYPRWGKDKLTVLLHGKGFGCSVSTVDWILHRLNELFYCYPDLGRAWVLQENFRNWYRGTNRSRVIIFTLIDVEPSYLTTVDRQR